MWSESLISRRLNPRVKAERHLTELAVVDFRSMHDFVPCASGKAATATRLPCRLESTYN